MNNKTNIIKNNAAEMVCESMCSDKSVSKKPNINRPALYQEFRLKNEVQEFEEMCCKNVAKKLKEFHKSRGLISKELDEHHKEMIDFSPEDELKKFIGNKPFPPRTENPNDTISDKGCFSVESDMPHYDTSTTDQQILTIVAEGRYLEARMRELGARGGGIKTMKKSINHLLPSWSHKHFELASRYHFNTLHREDYEITLEDTETFLEACVKIRIALIYVEGIPLVNRLQ